MEISLLSNGFYILKFLRNISRVSNSREVVSVAIKTYDIQEESKIYVPLIQYKTGAQFLEQFLN